VSVCNHFFISVDNNLNINFFEAAKGKKGRKVPFAANEKKLLIFITIKE